MDKAKAQAMVDGFNERELTAVKREVESFALKQLGMPVSDWLGQASFNDLIGMSLIVNTERERLMENRKVYHLAVWNTYGKLWSLTNLRDRANADWFVVTEVEGGYKAYTVGMITGNVLNPIPVECLDIVLE